MIAAGPVRADSNRRRQKRNRRLSPARGPEGTTTNAGCRHVITRVGPRGRVDVRRFPTCDKRSARRHWYPRVFWHVRGSSPGVLRRPTVFLFFGVSGVRGSAQTPELGSNNIETTHSIDFEMLKITSQVRLR